MSEATDADIEHLGLERGHRTLVITRKGGKVVTIPLAPRTARAIGLVAHVRAVRQVVRAEPAGQQLVDKRGHVAGPAAGVEDGPVRVGQGAQPAGCQRLISRQRRVMGGARREVHRLGQPADPIPGRQRIAEPTPGAADRIAAVTKYGKPVITAASLASVIVGCCHAAAHVGA